MLPVTFFPSNKSFLLGQSNFMGSTGRSQSWGKSDHLQLMGIVTDLKRWSVIHFHFHIDIACLFYLFTLAWQFTTGPRWHVTELPTHTFCHCRGAPVSAKIIFLGVTVTTLSIYCVFININPTCNMCNIFFVCLYDVFTERQTDKNIDTQTDT